MSNIFDHFTIVCNIVKHISWEDIRNFKKMNSLCFEVCEREEIRRCSRILFGQLSLSKKTHKSNKRMKCIMDDSTLIKTNFQCKNPKLVLIMSSEKEIPILNEIITSSCDKNTIICYAYSKHGNMGNSSLNEGMKFEKTFSPKSPGFSWLCLPTEIEADVLLHDSEIKANTKLVIVLNVSTAKDSYCTKIFEDYPNIENPVYYAGGLVNSIGIFDHCKGAFEKTTPHISIALSGDNLHIDTCVFPEDRDDSSSIRQAFLSLKERNDEFSKSNKIKYQCVLIFSCFLRKKIELKLDNDSSPVTEYEMFARLFPSIPILGVLCEGEIFHANDGVVKLIKRLHYHDVEGVTSIFLLMSWTE